MSTEGIIFWKRESQKLLHSLFDNDLSAYFSSVEGLEYVIAYGSYGRNEETYRIFESEKPKLYNDIDLILVKKLGHSISKNSIDVIRRDVEKIVGSPFVDLALWNMSDLSKVRRTVFYHDLCFGHKVIFGDKQRLNTFLTLDRALGIDSHDVFSMYNTRSWALLSALAKPNGFDDEFFNYQASKAAIAIADFKLIARDKYVSKLSQKVAYFRSVNDVDMVVLLESAIATKVRPSSMAMNQYCHESSSLLVKKYHEAFLEFVKSRFGLVTIGFFILLIYYCFKIFLKSIVNLSVTPLKLFLINTRLIWYVSKCRKSDRLDLNIRQKINKLLLRRIEQ